MKILELNKREEKLEEGISVLHTGLEIQKVDGFKMILDTKEGKYVVPLDDITLLDLYAQISDFATKKPILTEEEIEKILDGKIVEIRVGEKGFDLIIEKDGKKYCLDIEFPWGAFLEEE